MARVATGPGRIEPRRPAGGCSPRRNGFALYNFDIDDATVKVEHERWLDENLRPLLRSPGLVIQLRGTASRSGGSDYNQRLSQRRVDAVRNVLLRLGATAAMLDTSAVGEEEARQRGVVDGTESAKDRAVIVEIVPRASSEPTRFDRVHPGSNDGFDTSEAHEHPWLMVPFESLSRDIALVNAVGLTIESSNERVVRAERADLPGRPLLLPFADPQTVRLRGVQPGEAVVRVVDSCGRVHAGLRVSVLTRLTVKSAFHYVQNTGVGTRTRNVGDEVAFLATMNQIYEPQANIRFTSLGAARLPIADALGNEVNTDGRLGGDWNSIARHRNALAQFNVFFVREIERDAEGTTSASGAITDTTDAETVIGGDGDCIFEDSAGIDVGETLAHEAGHALGVRHNNPIASTMDMLMWDTTDERGRFIPRRHVVPMRRGVRR